MVEEIFGSGIKLDQDFDMVIDGTGDIGFERGLDELQKDFAFNTARNLHRRIGTPLSKTEKEITKVKVARILQQDQRVQSVDSVSIIDPDDDDEIVLEVSITVDDDSTYDLVIPVGE